MAFDTSGGGWWHPFNGIRRDYDINGTRMVTIEAGSGTPVVFLHGNPTWSYMWRDVVPHVVRAGRCIAIDLVGMGLSEKLSTDAPDRYRFVCHARYLDSLLSQLQLPDRIVLMMHDWGSALGFDWAYRNQDRVAGLAYCEGIMGVRTWTDFPKPAQDMFRLLRSDQGTAMMLEDNYFIETLLPRSVLNPLSEETMEMYRLPFREPGDGRMPTAVWPRELPIDGEPEDVCAIVERYMHWLGQSRIPKLLISADAGTTIRGRILQLCRAFPEQTEVQVHGAHYAIEDAPHEIGRALSRFVSNLPPPSVGRFSTS